MVKSLKKAILLIFLVNPVVFAYESASALPVYIDKKRGKVLLLLGKEQRSSGKYWFNFAGKKDNTDKNSYETAARELSEETAGYIAPKNPNIDQNPIYKTKNGSHEAYLIPVDFISACSIKPQKGQQHVEKYKWAWVDAKNLMDYVDPAKNVDLLDIERGVMIDKKGKKLYPLFKAIMRDSKVRLALLKLIADALNGARI